jgi:protein-S-isoprenylcysteine O-methyltransferase Ste14
MYFRYRLALMVAFFGAAFAMALAVARLEDPPAIVTPFGALVGVDVAFAVSGALCVLGFVLRTWGEVLLGATVYGQDTQVERLVTRGPFALSRNPLYVGTFVFYVGAFMPYLPPALLAVFAVSFAVLLWAIVRDEEKSLIDRADWQAYAARVPRFVGVVRGNADVGADVRVDVSVAAVVVAVVSNVFLLSLGAYRLLAVALGAPSKLFGVVNLLCLLIWLVAVIARRARH